MAPYIKQWPLTNRAASVKHVTTQRERSNKQAPRFPKPGYGPNFVLPNNYSNPRRQRIYL